MRYLATTLSLISLMSPAHAAAPTVEPKAAAMPAQAAVKPLDKGGIDFAFDDKLKINLRLVGNVFELYFVDARRVPVKELPEGVSGIVINANLPRSKNGNTKFHTSLRPAMRGEWTCLESVTVFPPPHVGTMRVTLTGREAPLYAGPLPSSSANKS